MRLKGERLDGLGFRKQHPVGPYILDFYCAAAKLAVEIDGASHEADARAAHDARRTVWLGGKGIRVIRIAARAVRDELDGVLDFIRREAERRVGRMPIVGYGVAPSVTALKERRATSPSRSDGEESLHL